MEIEYDVHRFAKIKTITCATQKTTYKQKQTTYKQKIDTTIPQIQTRDIIITCKDSQEELGKDLPTHNIPNTWSEPSLSYIMNNTSTKTL